MAADPRNIVVLGSTGSIGCSTLEVIAAEPASLRLLALSAHTQLEAAIAQCHVHHPRWLIATDREAARCINAAQLPAGTELVVGDEGVERIVSLPEVDVVVSAIVGSAGLRGSWAALEAGKRLALANKETLVLAGPLIMQLAQERHAELIPVDSEHSAIHQALHAGTQGLRRIILTASGGPFLRRPLEDFQHVTLEEALRHPTWNMGAKITIDSATMLNKALEIVEARWLFGVTGDQISVVIHPQSIAHSMIEYQDGSILAQLSPPDMKLPIQYALNYPRRSHGIAKRLDWTQCHELTFEPPDLERFPALELGHEVAHRGGTAGAVLNAAKETAVACFMDGQLAFHQIVTACRDVLHQHTFDPSPSLDQILLADAWARKEVTRWTMAS